MPSCAARQTPAIRLPRAAAKPATRRQEDDRGRLRASQLRGWSTAGTWIEAKQTQDPRKHEADAQRPPRHQQKGDHSRDPESDRGQQQPDVLRHCITGNQPDGYEGKDTLHDVEQDRHCVPLFRERCLTLMKE